MGTKVDLDGDYEMITKLGLDPPTSAGHVYEQGALRKRRARRQPAIWPLFIALAVSASVAFLLLKCAFHLQVNLSRSSRALSSGDGGDAWKTLLSHESCESSDDEASDTPRRRSPVSRWKLWTGRLTEGMASVYGGKRSYEPLRRVASTASSASTEGGATFASAEEGPSSASADRGASSASADRGASSASADRGASSASADRKASDVSAVVGHGGMGWVQHQTVLELGYPWAPHQLGFTLENPFIDIGGEMGDRIREITRRLGEAAVCSCMAHGGMNTSLFVTEWTAPTGDDVHLHVELCELSNKGTGILGQIASVFSRENLYNQSHFRRDVIVLGAEMLTNCMKAVELSGKVPDGGTVPLGFVIPKPQGPSTGEILIKVYATSPSESALRSSSKKDE